MLVFSVVFHVGKKGMLVLDAAYLSWLGEFSLFSELDFRSISDVFSVCGNGFVLADPSGIITPLSLLSHHQHLDLSWNDIWYQIRVINFPARWIKGVFLLPENKLSAQEWLKAFGAWKESLISLFWPSSLYQIHSSILIFDLPGYPEILLTPFSKSYCFHLSL